MQSATETENQLSPHQMVFCACAIVTAQILYQHRQEVQKKMLDALAIVYQTSRYCYQNKSWFLNLVISTAMSYYGAKQLLAELFPEAPSSVETAFTLFFMVGNVANNYAFRNNYPQPAQQPVNNVGFSILNLPSLALLRFLNNLPSALAILAAMFYYDGAANNQVNLNAPAAPALNNFGIFNQAAQQNNNVPPFIPIPAAANNNIPVQPAAMDQADADEPRYRTAAAAAA